MATSSAGAYAGEWWEFQANRMMGALLLPKRLVASCLEDLLQLRGMLGELVLPDSAREPAVPRLSDVFDVNPIVARLRIQQLYPAADPRQLTL